MLYQLDDIIIFITPVQHISLQNMKTFVQIYNFYFDVYISDLY